MTVTLTSPCLGQDVGYAYTGPLESWLKNHGYARASGTLTGTITVTPTAAVLTGTANALATVGTSGDVIFATKGGVRTTVALLTGDTAAQAATKIDTALAGLADAAIVSSKLQVTSIATGPEAYVTVVGGTAGVLTGLKVAVGAVAYGGDGRPTGASNLGVQDDTPANDPASAANREAPYFPASPDKHTTIANDADHLTLTKLAAPRFNFDAGAVNDDAPSAFTVSPLTGLSVNLVALTLHGQNFTGTTGVTFGGVAATSVVVVDDETITLVAPAHAAGAVDVIVTNNIGSKTQTGAYTYVAPVALTLVPVTGPAAGGTAVVITGQGFTGATSVTFGGTAGTAFSVVSDTEIHVTTPAKAAAAYDVIVVDAAGNQTKVNGFTYA